MKYRCVVNTFLGHHPLKKGDILDEKQIESVSDANLQSLLTAGFVVEADSKEESSSPEMGSDEPSSDELEMGEEVVMDAKPKKGKGKKS